MAIRAPRVSFALLFLVILLMMIVGPAVEVATGGQFIVRLLSHAVLLTVLGAAPDKHGPLFWAGVALAIPAVAASWAPGPTWTDVLALSSEAAFLIIANIQVATTVFRRERVTTDTVFGALCGYALLCLFFAAVYSLVEELQPGAFHVSAERPFAEPWNHLSYFSFVTLTTLGYGDIVPIHPGMRSLVAVQAMVGVLYPAIVIARMVSLYTEGGEARESQSPDARPPSDAVRSWRARRFELLLFALMALIVVTPWLELQSSIFFDVVSTGVMVSALLALGSERRVVWAGAGIATTVVFFRHVVARLDPSWAPVAIGVELGFYAFVVVRLARDVYSPGPVQRDTLFGAVCVYVLLAVVWSLAYALVASLQPDAFAFPDYSVAARTELNLLYFSMITLTTTGYGEIVPLLPQSEGLAIAESLVGILYPAVLVARLVSLYTQR